MQTNEHIIAELVWNAKAVYETIGKVPRVMRAPKGLMSQRTMDIMAALGISTIHWSDDTRDWDKDMPDYEKAVVDSVTEWAKTKKSVPGGVISLQHDFFDYSYKPALKTIPIVKNSGFKTILVSECIKQPAYVTSGPFYELVVKDLPSAKPVDPINDADSNKATTEVVKDDKGDNGKPQNEGDSKSAASSIKVAGVVSSILLAASTFLF